MASTATNKGPATSNAEAGSPTATAQSRNSATKKSADSEARRQKFKDITMFLKNSQTPDGSDLYALMQEIFNKLIEHYPDQALDKLEEVSFLLRNRKNVKLEDFLNTCVNKNYSKLTNDLAEYHEQLKPHFKAPEPEEEGGDIPEIAPVGFVQDLMADARVFSWAGIGFGEMETYRLQKSLKKLATDSGASNLRFFGKMHGTQHDYYIVEATLEGGEEEEDAGDAESGAEPKGTGVNKFTYYVTHNSLSEWVKLPDLNPQDLQSARQIKVLLTGDLERPIYSNPFFFGKEKHYLRAQIARIMHSTQLIPRDTFRIVEDDDRNIEENVNEESGDVPQLSTLEMGKAANWVHALPNILKTCRTAHTEPEAPEDQPEDEEFDPEEALKKIQAADPYEARLKQITSDSQIQISRKVYTDPWVVRLMGDTTEYQDESNPALKKTNEGVVVVRSLIWPGAYNIFARGKVMQIYLGSGHKFEQQSYFPIAPPQVLSDPEEYENGPEPTPLEAPVENADEDKKEEGQDDDE